jgi:alpha-ketoglutarate-dependent taurine dioxygenase
VRRGAVSISTAAVLHERATSAREDPFPAVFTPRTARDQGQLLDWVQAELPRLRAALRRSGALLLRGFALVEPAQFAAVATVIGGPLDERYEGPSPRSALGARGVYTASEVSPWVSIAEHAELSYLPQMPRHVFFWCRTPALHGGETTLVDGRRVLARLDRASIAPLLRAPLKIRRRHARARGPHDPFELKRWPTSFPGADREQVLARARALGFQARFDRLGSLTLEHEQPMVRLHPETGEAAWLNHLLVFHGSSPVAALALEGGLRGGLRARAMRSVARAYRAASPWLGYPVATDVRLADGSPIDDHIVQHVREAVARETVPVGWRAGDLVVVDNHIALHGRRPFRGARSVIAAWSAARA